MSDAKRTSATAARHRHSCLEWNEDERILLSPLSRNKSVCAANGGSWPTRLRKLPTPALSGSGSRVSSQPHTVEHPCFNASLNHHRGLQCKLAAAVTLMNTTVRQLPASRASRPATHSQSQFRDGRSFCIQPGTDRCALVQY